MFDRHWILTIERNAKKFGETMAHLRERGIDAEKFDGFDADVTGLETRWKYEVDNPRTGYKMGPRTSNLYLSHYAMWKCATYATGDSFLILEDDVRFDEDWRDHMASALHNLPQDWDMLYIGSCCCEDRPKEQIRNRLYRVEMALCTHAYAVRRKALPVLLDKCKKFWSGIDIEIAVYATPHLNTYAILPRIASQWNTVISP